MGPPRSESQLSFHMTWASDLTFLNLGFLSYKKRGHPYRVAGKNKKYTECLV